MSAHEAIIGVDWATDPKRVGLAWAEADGPRPRVVEVCSGADGSGDPVMQVAGWIPRARRTLIALDAPLGWPAAMGRALADHRAGMPIDHQADLLFQRETDRVVHRLVGRRPLEVGADRIARTALTALAFIDGLASALDMPISVAWDPDDRPALSVIEVYPAGTLTAYGLHASGYKRADQRDARQGLIDAIEQQIELRSCREPLLGQADLLDAVLSILAGQDFLRGLTLQPDNPELARREGWIQVRPRSTNVEPTVDDDSR